MSKLLDPTICPDCRARLVSGGVCPACGLHLQGPIAAQLWQTMRAADALITQLRAQVGLAATPTGAPLASAGPGPFPAAPPSRAPRRAVSTLSVPVVLLSLGALCLLVAGVVFIAVTWSSLGLTGRTLVLGGFTTLLAALAVVLTRRDLRGAAETLWLVVAGMLVLDLVGAREAGLLGELDWRGASALVGGALLGLGVVVGWWATGQPVRRLYAVQVVGVLGGGVVTATNAWGAGRPAVGTSLALPALLVLALVTWRRARVVATGLVALALADWLVLLAIGTDRAAELEAFGSWWQHLRGWPLVVAAVAAALILVPPRLLARAGWARSLFAGMALVPLVVLANAPRTLDADRTVVVASATLAVLAALTRWAPVVWARAAGVLTAVGSAVMGSVLVATTLGLVVPARPTAPASLGERLSVGAGFPLDFWVPLAVAGALAAAAAALVRIVPEGMVSASRLRGVVPVVGCGLLAVGVADLLVALEPPLWTAVAVMALGTCGTAACTWSARHDVLAGVTGALGAAALAALTLATAAPSDLASALVLSLLAVAAALVFARRDGEGGVASVGLAGIAAGLLGGIALDRWGLVMGADGQARSLALAVYAVVVGVVAEPAARRTLGRVALEVAAVLVGLAAVVGFAGDRATVLTILGTGVCLVAVLFRDRNDTGWLGAAVLAAATLVRVAEDVTAPEAYTLPAAALLLAVGLWRLRAEERLGSLSALGSGLSLALVPSLLLAVEDPVSTRAALVAAGGLAVLALGVHRRLLAPFLFGAVVTAVLALRELEPVAAALPRWVTLGAVGVVLLAVGITWEARLRNVHTARRYLTTLR